MARPREHVHGDAGGGGITLPGKRGEIARERAGVAGDIHDPLRLHPDGVGDDALVQPAPRRIDDDYLRADAAPGKLRGGLARVGAEKFALVRKMIPLCVVPRVFHGGGNDLRADDARAAGGHAKADRPRAAVEIERRHARRDTGIAERGFIQPLGLRRVHLEKRAGRERERETAQPLGEHLAAPNGIKLSGKHGVAAGRVAVEHEPGYIRAALAQHIRKYAERFFSRRAGRGERQHRLFREMRRTVEDMAHAVSLRGLVVDRDMLPLHPVKHCLRTRKRFLRYGGAVRHGDNLVRARAVKPGDGTAVLLCHIEDHLAALPGVFRRGENAGDGKVQLPDAVKRVVHTLQFQRKLLLIIHVAQRAAAATGVCRAVRLRAVR